MKGKKRAIRAFLSRLIRNEQGLEMVEYMLIAALVVLGLIIGFKYIGQKMTKDQNEICKTLEISCKG